MNARVRVADSNSLEVVGHGSLTYAGLLLPDQDALPEEGELHFAGTVEGTSAAGLASLRQALLRWPGRSSSSTLRVVVSLSGVVEADFDLSRDSGRSVLVLAGNRLLVKARTSSEWPAVSRLLSPLLERHKASLVKVGFESYGDIAVDWPIRGRSVADALRFHDELRVLLSAADGGELTPSTTLDILRAGRWDVLHGQPESSWLDAKGAPYANLKGNGKYELAKDIAAFANSPDGGLIVLGMCTKKNRDGVDTIRRVEEFELAKVRRQSYRDLVERWVYPRVVGFEVERIEGASEGRGLAVLLVPPQAETSLPFLVQGTYLSDKVLGAHVLFPVRRGDDTTAMDAASMHARLRLGNQVIAGKRKID
jgi:hypothetical protein